MHIFDHGKNLSWILADALFNIRLNEVGIVQMTDIKGEGVYIGKRLRQDVSYPFSVSNRVVFVNLAGGCLPDDRSCLEATPKLTSCR